jgi:LuxR family transcriptional regulator, maltose regulon positive regulatory protein
MPEARLVVPALPPRCISRPRLIHHLNAATERPLTLIAAGAGSGKTVLLTEWANSWPDPVAWISVIKADNDPARFWPLVAGAFSAAGIDNVVADVDDYRSSPLEDGSRVIDPYLVATRVDQPQVLIIDDAHLLTHPLILEALDGVLNRGQTRLRLVLSARHDPLLALHRYRLAGQMAEIRARDLAMTAAEAQALLAAHDVALPTSDFDVLMARTEGWTAGLRLSAMSMEGTDRPADFVSEFAMDQGSVGEYLMNEVFERQTDDVRNLLIETSFLDEVSGELAAAVTGFGAAGETLAELARTNAFVVPLDRTSGRYRYHQQLREILHYLLRQQPATRRDELLSLASSWYYRHGHLSDALHTAADGQDWPHVATVLVRGGFVRAYVDNEDLSYLSHTQLAGRPESDDGDLPLARAALHAMASNAAGARHELSVMAGAASPPSGARAEQTLALTELLIARAEYRYHDLVALADRITSQVGDDAATLKAAILLELGSAQFWEGRYDDTDSSLLDAYEHAVAAGHRGLQLKCLAQLALVHAHWGRLRSCQNEERRANALLRDHDDLSAPTTLLLAAAVRAFYQADFQSAMRSMQRVQVALATESHRDVRAAARLFQGVLLASTGQVGAAQAVLSSSLELAGEMVEDFRKATLGAIETTLGRPNAAVKLLGGGDASRRSSSVAVELARAYLCLGKLRMASATLRPTLAPVNTAPTRILVIEALMMQAQIALAADEESGAVEHLVRACELSAGEIRLPFVRVADIFQDVLARHSSLAALWPTAASDVLTIPSPAEPDTVDIRLPEALTDRERTVLRWLSTTMSTAEIAEELCLSVNTVKTHIAAIYRKLAAAKRRDAVLRARTLELL